MRKVFLFIIMFFLALPVLAEDYRKIYRDTPVPDFAYIHGVDPKHFFENRYASYSVYPLLRLSSPLFYKTITVTPGYYDLSPREHEGKDYVLFKQNGLVVHILPVFKKEPVPPGFYKKHLKREKRAITQKIGDGFHKLIGKICKHSFRTMAAKTYLEVNDVDDNFVVLVVYYDDFRYYVLMRSVKM